MIENTGIPKFLYKYREPDLEKILKIVSGGELWAADPTAFNDPFDCLPYIDETLTKEEEMEIFEKKVTEKKVENCRKNRRIFIKELRKEIKNNCSTEKKKFSLLEKGIKNIGVVCLSQCNSSVLMWSHYAKNHTGVCIEISTENSPVEKAAEVNYSDQRPVLKAFQAEQPNIIKNILLKKAKNWEYEKEWRYFTVVNGSRKLRLPKGSVTKIILGARVNEKFQNELEAKISSNGLNVELINATLDNRKYIVKV